MREKFLTEISFAFETLPKKLKITAVILAVIFIVSFLILLNKLNNKLMVDVPVTGGTLTEGVVGSPRFINPLLAVSDTDRDLTVLVYSGLLRLKTNGDYQPDLAEKYEISPDGLTYTFYLREDLYWSDGKPLTANDIIFTIAKTQDQAIKSPKRANWNGVVAQKIDNQTVQFSLKKAYNFFLDNATLGILPEHLWAKVKSEQFSLSSLNMSPVGSGPYKLVGLEKNNEGIPLSANLTPFKKFALGSAKINLTLRFYNSDKERLTALQNGEIASAGAMAPADAKTLAENGQKIIRSPLPRTFAVFLNQSRNLAFLDPSLRQALDLAVDRQKLVSKVLLGYGKPLTKVLPNIATKDEKITGNLEEARAVLTKNNWQWTDKGELVKKITAGKNAKTATKNQATGPVVFSLATANINELKTASELLANDWRRLGIKVNLEFFEPGDLNQEVIRPRRFDALLFGEVTGRNNDLYPFWHSSQRLDPGLNISLYANNKVDKLLEEIRQAPDTANLPEKYDTLIQEINKDQPAIFLYQPDFLYIAPTGLQGLRIPTITNPADRFTRVHEWYFQTDRVWFFLSKFASYF